MLHIYKYGKYLKNMIFKSNKTYSTLSEAIDKAIAKKKDTITESRGIRSKKIYNAYKQYGGWDKNDCEHSVCDVHELTDDDVIGVLPNDEIRKIQAGHNVDHGRWIDNWGLDKWAKEEGYNIIPGDRVDAIKLGDGKHSLVVITRNASLYKDRQDGWRKHWDKVENRERNRRLDGKNQYFWKNKKAEDIFHNPWFKKWPKEDQAAAINKAREFRNRLNEAIDEAISEKLAVARKTVNTDPTEAQKKAENYRMGHVSINGFQISIENPKGSYRKGKDRNGKEWKTLMHNDYGYFTKTVGKDGDAIDVFIGDNYDSKKIFAVDQRINGEFDETKVMFCFNDAEQAKKAYLSNYQKDWKGFWKITETDIDTFKKWLYDGHRQRKPFFDYKEIAKKKLNEGAWGYDTDQSDQALDAFANFIDADAIIARLEKKCTPVSKSGESAWQDVCLIDNTIDMLESTNECGYHITDSLLDIFDKSIEACQADEKWIEGWKEPKKMRNSLVKLKKKSEALRNECRTDKKNKPNTEVGEPLNESKRECSATDKELEQIVNKYDNEKRSRIRFHEYGRDEYGTNIITIYGGLNGCGEWDDYLEDILSLYNDLSEKYHVWIVDLDVDCCDDVWTLLFGIRNKDKDDDSKSEFEEGIRYFTEDYFRSIAKGYGLNETKNYNVNMDVELAKPERTAPKISTDEFFEHVKTYYLAGLDPKSEYDMEKKKSFDDNPDKKADKGDLMYVIRHNSWKDKNSNIFKDLNKIKHDWENCDYIGDVRTTKSGVPYILGDFGGDWEEPILFMIYWDGKEFRGYIPKHGNCYNRDLNQAFGNNDEADEKFIMKNVTNNDGDYYKIKRNLSFNKEECIKDFESRLKVKKGHINEALLNEKYEVTGKGEKFILHSNGAECDSICTLTDEAGGKFYIGTDDGCMVLYCALDDGTAEPTTYIFPEAFNTMKRLPDLPLTESKEEKKGIDKFLEKHGIKEVSCGLGYSEEEKKWYGWSHRAIYGFTVGSKVKKGDVAYNGKEWTAKTMEDAKKMAEDFSKNIS